MSQLTPALPGVDATSGPASIGVSGRAPVPADRLGLIAARARTLDERLADAVSRHRAAAGALSTGPDPELERRLCEWRTAVAAGDEELFTKRLAWDALTLDHARAALVDRPSSSPLLRPAWLETLSEVLDDAAVPVPVPVSGPAGATGPMPFEEVLAPFVGVAAARAAATAGTAWDRLAAPARQALTGALSATLCTYAAQTLQLEFSVWRAPRQSGLDRLLGEVTDEPGHRLYAEFTAALHDGGLVDLFVEYAVLARLLSTVTDLWVEATLEFVGRLDADWSALQAVFGPDAPLGQVAQLRPSLSDPHRGRRSVIAVTFTSGRQVVYKPKDLGVDAAYDRLLVWLTARGAPADFRRPALLVRDGYGWVEFVTHVPHSDGAETARYYRNSGAVLCLLHVLGATDCHFENVIAAGEHPVPIDLETLLHHHSAERRHTGTEAEWLAEDELARSVLATSMLPVWQIGDNGANVYDVSGLGGLTEQETPYESAVWSRINTDRMTLRFQRAAFRPTTNVPVLTGPVRGPAEHRQEIVDGFRDTYRFLAEQRDPLLAKDGPLADFRATPVRVLLRNTSLYGRLHQQLMQPRYLRDGRDRGIYLERLCRLFLDRTERPTLWPAVAAERTAMERPDIPYLAALPSNDALELETGNTVPGSFLEPSLDTLFTLVAELNEPNLARQLGFIEGSLYAHAARDAAAVPATTPWSDPGLAAARPRTADSLCDRAFSLVDELAGHAVRGTDGSAVWLAPQYLVKVGRYQFQAVGHDLYGGGSGIGLALAAAARLSGDRSLRALALAALRPLRQALREEPTRTAHQLGLGAAGLGGAVYALTRAAELVEDETLTVDATRAARLIEPGLIAADTASDVMSGSAGAILGLLAHTDAQSSSPVAVDDALARAVACGEQLLARRRPTSAGHLAWPAGEDRFLTGFSHGAAGIAYALGRLFERSGDERFAEAAAEAIAYEDSQFLPAAGNWRDLRAEAAGGPHAATRWCHGAPGIVLARLGTPALGSRPPAANDPYVARGLETTRQYGLERVDHVCCGNLGRVEVLLSAGIRLDRNDLVDDAHAQLAAVLDRADKTDPRASAGFLLHPLAGQIYTPGFFQGTAGLVYGLLRMAYPDQLPSVLLWE